MPPRGPHLQHVASMPSCRNNQDYLLELSTKLRKSVHNIWIRLLLFRPSTCWKRPLVFWLWKLLWNYISNIYISICIYLLALRCLCGGFHGSMPPQNQVGSSMVIGFIIYLKLICSECHGCHQPPTSCDNSHKKQLGSVLRRGVLVNFLHRPSSWLNLRLQ